MPKIETRENKRLRLVNVISRELQLQELLSGDNRHMFMLENFIKRNKYTIVGPLIMYTGSMMGMDANGVPIIKSKLMVQIKEENIKIEEPYRFEKEVVAPNCLMARFIGKQDDVEYASKKLSIIAYEEDIKLTEETYMIFVNENQKESIIDVFMPVKGA